jgi:hypothetical protein
VESIVQAVVEKFCEQMKECRGGPVDFSLATRAMALDVIADMCFDTKYDAIQQKEMGASFLKITEVINYFWALNTYLPGKAVDSGLIECLPTWILEILDPGVNAREKWIRVSLAMTLR